MGNTAMHLKLLHPSAEESNDTRRDRVKGCPREYTHIHMDEWEGGGRTKKRGPTFSLLPHSSHSPSSPRSRAKKCPAILRCQIKRQKKTDPEEPYRNLVIYIVKFKRVEKQQKGFSQQRVSGMTPQYRKVLLLFSAFQNALIHLPNSFAVEVKNPDYLLLFSSRNLLNKKTLIVLLAQLFYVSLVLLDNRRDKNLFLNF
jgi:hypothetical protein